jgi:hypothetical protein
MARWRVGRVRPTARRHRESWTSDGAPCFDCGGTRILAPALHRGFSYARAFAPLARQVNRGYYVPDMPLALSDHQLELVMTAAGPLVPEKRVVLMERIVAALRVRAGVFRRPTDADIEHATRAALRGLVQEPVA